jgi:hypothetical protein
VENDKNEELKKKVDETWKESVDKDKNTVGTEKEAPQIPEATFGLFIYGLMMEAMIALGEVEHPITKKKELSSHHAKFIIDTLGMLQSKTKGNLTKDEGDMLEGMLYDLRMRFVSKAAPQKP